MMACFSVWVCYMDAGAYIADLNFNLAEYHKDKDDIAIITAPGATTSSGGM